MTKTAAEAARLPDVGAEEQYNELAAAYTRTFDYTILKALRDKMAAQPYFDDRDRAVNPGRGGE